MARENLCSEGERFDAFRVNKKRVRAMAVEESVKSVSG